ncbi:TIGR04438 family Trp-rich protein [Actimicrobium sp. CCC2.4]|uniref:TIGR04438 family Trp-rich protein n=1 Tax=Actimicrobium sp. CCC2.4 TaxID=3048606 RepID=UPI002AC9091A|nr:TIGR04438 family Trp-rich protein [Actimicrobium sp. CCC2.4]MEB0135816.1 TIGR04438 family Trp-rich protein [Actimicrobium sp. CCC2.4]WPX33295.1 TIGR04438 family Trp-rich protein [Actimicrobium sp. CCC2.4]
MPIIILIVVLGLLRYFELGPVANLSWWWIAGLFGVAFIWFEFIEPIFGLDKRKAHDDMDRIREERVRKTFEKKPPRR